MKKSKKIGILTYSLSSGGAEKMAANMSVSLSKKGFDVFVVSMEDKITYTYGGTLFNFGKIKKENSKLVAFIKFRKFFKNQVFDVIIDHRVRNNFFKEYFLSKLVFKKTFVLYVVHHYKLGLYFPKLRYPSLTKLTLANNNKIIVVSKLIKAQIIKQLNIESQVIYNYTISHNGLSTELENYNNYIIGVGRLVKVKQFDVLIEAYKASNLPFNNIKLLIVGEGEEREALTKLIKNLGLENLVELVGFKNNIDSYIKNAKAIVLSSHSEGFPMVLVEALALKTPIISFDCESGPNEIVLHNENGLLVENQNYQALSNAIDKLILDNDFYAKIKENINNSVNPFSEEDIMSQWLKLL